MRRRCRRSSARSGHICYIYVLASEHPAYESTEKACLAEPGRYIQFAVSDLFRPVARRFGAVFTLFRYGHPVRALASVDAVVIVVMALLAVLSYVREPVFSSVSLHMVPGGLLNVSVFYAHMFVSLNYLSAGTAEDFRDRNEMRGRRVTRLPLTECGSVGGFVRSALVHTQTFQPAEDASGGHAVAVAFSHLPEFSKGLCLYLPDTLPRYSEFAAYRLESPGL